MCATVGDRERWQLCLFSSLWLKQPARSCVLSCMAVCLFFSVCWCLYTRVCVCAHMRARARLCSSETAGMCARRTRLSVFSCEERLSYSHVMSASWDWCMWAPVRVCARTGVCVLKTVWVYLRECALRRLISRSRLLKWTHPRLSGCTRDWKNLCARLISTRCLLEASRRLFAFLFDAEFISRIRRLTDIRLSLSATLSLRVQQALLTW